MSTQGRVSGGSDMNALALRMKKGDAAAAAALYREVAPKSFGFFFSRLGNRAVAEDLAQESMMRMVEKLDSFDIRKSDFAVWYWTIARNLFIDHLRSHKEKPRADIEDHPDLAGDTDIQEDAEKSLQQQKLREFVDDLTDEERELYELRYIAELPYDEIADVLKRKEGALRVAVNRLKTKIEKHFHEGD